jgi:serine/threonine protein phosphatase 1
MLTGQSKTPDGLRLYAIGDIHGCDDKLAAVHAAIAADLAARPSPDHRIIHLGDYVDRGPNSAAVIERVMRGAAADPRFLCLKGNHDELLLMFLADPEEMAPTFLKFGGKETARSYGVSNRGLNYAGLARQLAEKMPAEHLAFLRGLPLSLRFGDYVFCHAGIRPGVPLDAQTAEDLTWIRDGFIDDTRDHGAVIVHGHTVTATQTPEIHSNRIAIDTGAVFGGPLTCVALEGTDIRFL